LLLGTVPTRAFAVNYSTATDTTDSDFNSALLKSSVTIQGSGDDGYVEISTKTAEESEGGTITYTDSSGLNPRSSPPYAGGYTVHTFTSNGTFTSKGFGNVEVLVVAGGGGGGGGLASGGGAGGFRTDTGFTVTLQEYTVTVGAGGAGGVGTNTLGASGSNSVFGSIISAGGGGGGHYTDINGLTGGSGGGRGGASSGGSGSLGADGNTPATDPSQGNNGGANFFVSVSGHYSGGGGGAGAVGGNASSGGGGAGGNGTVSSISGSVITYAGGGGGCGRNDVNAKPGGAGGSGGGGVGAGNNGLAGSGAANTGGGGGGGRWTDGPNGGNGGSGIVIVRYLSLSCYRPAGEVRSRVHDTTEVGTSWGEISWGESTPAGTDIKLKTRTGDNDSPPDGWSSWYPAGDVWYEVNTGTPIGSLRARYIQYLSSFTTTISTHTPQLTEVNIQFSTNSATAPSLTSPDSSWNNLTPVFDWVFGDNENDTQTAYQIQLSTDINFSMVNYSTGPYSSVYSSMTWPSANPIDDGIYWWQCKTRDSYNKWSVWSDTYQVKVDTIAPVNKLDPCG